MSAGLSMVTRMRAARTIFSLLIVPSVCKTSAYELRVPYQVLPMCRTLIPSGLVFHRYGSMCTCKFLLPMWHCALSSISMSCDVALNAGGRFFAAISAVSFAVETVCRCCGAKGRCEVEYEVRVVGVGEIEHRCVRASQVEMRPRKQTAQVLGIETCIFGVRAGPHPKNIQSRCRPEYHSCSA